MDLFRSSPVTGTNNPAVINQQNNQSQPGNIPQNSAIQSTPGNGVVPANQENSTASEKEESPLDSFKDMWKNEDKSDDSQEHNMFNVDQSKLLEAAKKVDFSRAISPELIQKISAGGEEAAAALPQILNQVTQTVYAQSTLASTKIMEKALEQQREQFQKELPNIIKSHSLNDSLRNDNPIFSNPAVAPMLDMVKNQLVLKHPDSTASELQKMAIDFVEKFAKTLSPPKEDVDKKGNSTSKGEDWSKFFSL